MQASAVASPAVRGDNQSHRSESILSFHAWAQDEGSREVNVPATHDSIDIKEIDRSNSQHRYVSLRPEFLQYTPKIFQTAISSVDQPSSRFENTPQLFKNVSDFSTAQPRLDSRIVKGLVYMTLGSLLFGINSLLVKKVQANSLSKNTLEIMFYRGLFMMIMLFVMHRRQQSEEENSRESELPFILSSSLTRSSSHIAALSSQKEKKFVQVHSVLQSIITFSFFYGLQTTPLFEAVALLNCSLLFTVLFSLVCLRAATTAGGKVRLELSAALIVLGIYFISSSDELALASLLITLVGGSLTTAISQEVVSSFQADTNMMTLLFYTAFVQLISTPILMLFCGLTFTRIAMYDLLILAVMAAMQIITTQLLQKSFLSFPPGYAYCANIHSSLTILISPILGNYFLHETIGAIQLTGAILISSATIIIILLRNLHV